MKKILVLLGPNLNMIGVREKGIYGTETAESIDAQIRDYADKAGCAFVEVHMSNIYAREEFRHHSVISPVCAGQIAGFGKNSYFLAIDALKRLL